MSNKRALIVDDSKTAQFKLKKILEDFDLNIDSVYSAEDALSYLSYQVPDIIFMDHSMKGMSGLDAVKIIKLNPVTAVIPVVMYTAEKGDVYVSQARAVGAMEVLSKDMMTESDIEHVMQSANMLSKTKSKNTLTEQKVNVTPQKVPEKRNIAVQPPEMSANLIDVRNQVSRALELQQSKIQRDIQDSSRMITRRLMHEMRELNNSFKQQNKTPPITVFSDLIESLEPPKQRSVLWHIVPMLILLGLVAYSIYQTNSLKQENEQLVAENQRFADNMIEQNEDIIASVKRLEFTNAGLSDEREYAYENIILAINQNSYYEFGEFAVDTKRTESLSELLFALEDADFDGIVNLYINTGNFCVSTNSSGELVLPVADARLSDCKLIEYYYPDPSQVEKTVFEFNTLINTHSSLIEADIEVALYISDRYSNDEPYPEYDESIPTSIWNDIAFKNNTVIFELEPY